MRGGIRIGKRIKEDLIYIRKTLDFTEDMINDNKTKSRIKTSKKILDKYLNPEVYYAERIKNKN
ncbi:hypothetical protein [Caloramator australicus]|uniref:Uncharacterized protein n=1 Tax=Caloramator australicus RC3 TaxID=857293 RepID=I7J4Q4_9CLOT|nr:hypothetical protein [Caloramator australicus]CCJ32871.1 hypothetical protein CAAU_0787 [Caloramator australicus RC3]